jgi:hypothetical protein
LATKLAVTLAPNSTVHMIYRTTTDISSDGQLCLCANAIYPLYFTADYKSTDGTSAEVAAAQTFVPSFTRAPAKARVGWLWPLLDRPHRLTQDGAFSDDDLATEVLPGGRLDQLLRVVERVAARQVPMTLVTDPDLIDELAVMSGIDTAAPYEVTTAAGTAPGTGTTAATAWLQRLRDVLAAHASIELAFTRFADPAVESMTQAGLEWSVDLSATMQARVTDALGGSRTPLYDIAWPAQGTISKPTLATLVRQGTRTVVVNDRVLPGGSARTIIPDALAPVATTAGPAVAAVTSTPIQRWVGRVLAPGGEGLAVLPDLVAELAIRVVTSLDQSHYILIAPPRNLTVDPAVAVRAILDTSLTSWSSPLALRAATRVVTPVDHGALTRVAGPELPAATVRSLRDVAEAYPELGSLFTTDADRTAQLGGVPDAVQRCESTSLLLQDRRASIALARQLQRQLQTGIRAQVYLVPPSNGTYTLASRKSQLPVTIWNKLDLEVQVKISVTSVSGVPGLSAPDLIRKIRPNSKVQIPVPTEVDRAGHFDVDVSLSTPDGLPLGDPVFLSVRSTALGTIGVVITIAAAVVLACALVVRFVQRMRKRKLPRPPIAASVTAAGSR